VIIKIITRIGKGILGASFIGISTIFLTYVVFNKLTESERGNPNFGDLTRGLFYLVCCFSFGISIALLWAFEKFLRYSLKDSGIEEG
jgi:hypothetical protein